MFGALVEPLSTYSYLMKSFFSKNLLYISSESFPLRHLQSSVPLLLLCDLPQLYLNTSLLLLA